MNVHAVASKAFIRIITPPTLVRTKAIRGAIVIPVMNAKAANMILFSGDLRLHILDVKMMINSVMKSTHIRAGICIKYPSK